MQFKRLFSSSILRATAVSSICTGMLLGNSRAYAKDQDLQDAEEMLIEEEARTTRFYGARIRNFAENEDLKNEAVEIMHDKGHFTHVVFVIHNHLDHIIMKNLQTYSYGGKWRKAPLKTLLPHDANVSLATHPAGGLFAACSGLMSCDLDDFERRIHLMYYCPGSASRDNWLALSVTPISAKCGYDVWYAMNYGEHLAIDTQQLVKKGRWRWIKVRQGIKRRSKKDCCIEMPRFGCKVFAEMSGERASEVHLHFLPIDAPLPYKFKEYIIDEHK